MLVATLLMTVFTVWCALATSYNSLIAARIFQAMGGAAADTVAPSLIGDVYFIHERGRAMVGGIRSCTSIAPCRAILANLSGPGPFNSLSTPYFSARDLSSAASQAATSGLAWAGLTSSGLPSPSRGPAFSAYSSLSPKHYTSARNQSLLGTAPPRALKTQQKRCSTSPTQN